MTDTSLEATTQAYLHACARRDAAKIVSFLDPAESSLFQRQILGAADLLAPLGENRPLLQLLGVKAIDELRALAPRQFMERFIGSQFARAGEANVEVEMTLIELQQEGDRATARFETHATISMPELNLEEEIRREREVELSRRGGQWYFHYDTRGLSSFMDRLQAKVAEFNARAGKDRPDLAPEEDDDLEPFQIWGYRLSDTEETVIWPRFRRAEAFSCGLGAVKSLSQWGYIDRAGKVVIPPAFPRAAPFSEDLAAVGVETDEFLEYLYGFIDKTGELVIEPRFKEVDSFSQGLAPATLDEEAWGYIDRTGAWALEPRYESADPFDEDGHAEVALDGECLTIDVAGDTVEDDEG